MLETRGIGRPSTYAPIITTIQDRGYVKIEEKKFKATELGIKVTEKLNEFFPKIMDFSFTSEMENNLDKIEEAKEIWQGVVDSFYKMFSHDLQHAYDNMESLKQNPETSEHKCDKCQAVMVYKYNKRENFLDAQISLNVKIQYLLMKMDSLYFHSKQNINVINVESH